MSNQITMSDLLVDLSTEQQQLLAGGQNGEEGDSGDKNQVMKDRVVKSLLPWVEEHPPRGKPILY